VAKKTKKEHKFKYDPVNNPDSMWSRFSSTKKMKDSDQIKKMLGIEDEEPGEHDISAKQPLKMMDIVLQTWGQQEPGEEDEDDDEGMD
jgi:hypothetical protein